MFLPSPGGQQNIAVKGSSLDAKPLGLTSTASLAMLNFTRAGGLVEISSFDGKH